MTIEELKKQMGLNFVLPQYRKVMHPKNYNDMCYVIGYTYPMKYEKVKRLNIPDERISSFQPFAEWLQERNAYLEEERKKNERHARKPF